MEVVSAFLGSDGSQQVADFRPERIDGAFGGFAKEGLESGEEFFNGIEVR